MYLLPRYRFVLALGLTCSVLPASLRAEETTSRYGIIGLFSADRQQDLRDVLAQVPDVQLDRVDFDTAEVTLRYDLRKLLPGANPKKSPSAAEVLQRIDNLLASASSGSFRVKPCSTVPQDTLTKVEIDVGIHDCKGCRFGVYRIVTRIDGVERATVGANPSRLTAWIDGTRTNRDALESALKKAGVGLPSKQP